MEYSVLTIVPASKVNVGNYTCIVKNDFGEDRHTALFLLKGIYVYVFFLSSTIYFVTQ